MPETAYQINDIPTQGAVRQPRAIVKVNEQPLPGWVDWEVNNNANLTADTFRVRFALSAVPPQFDAAWWAGQTKLSVEIFAGFPRNPANFNDGELQSLIYGNADEIEFDPVRSQVILTGRDLTALLIDTKTTENWANQTSSYIVRWLAMRHGFSLPKQHGEDVIAPTLTKVGAYYEQDTVNLQSSRTEWDLLTYLATKEGFVVYVSGKTLYFQPRPDPNAVIPYVLKWTPAAAGQPPQFNGIHLQFSRNLAVAKGVIVVAQSTLHKGAKVLQAVYPKGAAPTTPGTSGLHVPQTYYFRRLKNYTQQMLDQFAANKHREITRHEMKLEASMPGDTLLGTRSVIKVVGTGSMRFDQAYFPDSITRRMSLDGGFTMDVHAKNHNTDTETLA